MMSLTAGQTSNNLTEQSIGRCIILCLGILVALAANCRAANKRSFTVTDDIELAHFIDPFQTGLRSPVKFSPDGRHLSVVTERGVLKNNNIEDTVWLFSVSDMMSNPGRSADAVQSFAVQIATVSARRSPAISYIRWLDDSSGLVFIGANSSGKHQLLQVDVSSKKLRRLSDDGQDVTAFDIQNRHIIYSTLDPSINDSSHAAESVTIGTGLDLGRILLDKLPESPLLRMRSLCDLWTLVDGKPVRVEDIDSHRPIHIHQPANNYGKPVFRLSPDGTALVAQVPVEIVPKTWELLQPSNELPSRRIKAGPQNIEAANLLESVNEFVLIDISTGHITPLTNAPIGWEDAYYSVYPASAWAPDGQNVVLANTFLGSEIIMGPKRVDSKGRPCIAVVNTITLKASCAVRLPLNTSELHKHGLHRMIDAHFGKDRDNIVVDAIPERLEGGGGDHGSIISVRFKRNRDGTWMGSGSSTMLADQLASIKVSVQQDLNSRPILVARDRESRVALTILDPNRSLSDVALGGVSIYHWKDKQGRMWTGGLIKPPNYAAGVKYPLILQTHGFDPATFMSYGSFPSCMAAREFSASGFLVLQIGGPVNEYKWDGTSQEGPMEVAGFDGAADQLAVEGLADRHKVGIIGFSRTVYGVMQALTKGSTKYGAAAICDGIQVGYLEYMLSVDAANNQVKKEFDMLIGSPPFGQGLQTWLKRSPNFNLERITAPLMVQAFGDLSTLFMWEPYAGLRLLNKPVDLVVVNADDEHVLSSPAARLASQGTDVDWFRFWLQGYEGKTPDYDPDRYVRWRKLRELQQQNEKKAVATKKSH
jgi:hypothetical protein